MMRKKGQAAMEFLMTYGWAILVVLAAIGALAYFGVLSPDRFLPNKCTLSDGFSCTEYKVNRAGNVQMTVQNNRGEDLSYANVTLSGKGATVCGPVVVVDSDGMVNGNNFGTGLETYACGAALTGSKFQGDVTINYRISGQTVTHLASGSIVAKIE